MLFTALKAILGILLILGGWLLVQAAWRRVFPGTPVGEDALAGRLGCHQCSCDSPCDRARLPDHSPIPHSRNNPTERTTT